MSLNLRFKGRADPNLTIFKIIYLVIKLIKAYLLKNLSNSINNVIIHVN